MAVIINASTSTGLVQSADTSGIIQFQSNGSTKATLNSSGFSYPGAVLQVVSTTKTDTFSTSSTTFVDVTGYSVSITPTSSSSKILVICNITATAIGAAFSVHGRLMRGSTPIAVGDAAGSRQQASYMWEGAQEAHFGISVTYLDSPATTSSTTYKMQVRSNNGTYTTYVNRASTDSDSSAYARTASTITVMEIAA